MNYLTALENEKNIVNAAVWDYSGPVNANQVATVCQSAYPLACCNYGGTGITDSNEKEVLSAWALTCNTYNTVQDGGASAVTCWTSHFHQGCTDYDNLLEGGSCGSSSESGGGSRNGTSGNTNGQGGGGPNSGGSSSSGSNGSSGTGSQTSSKSGTTAMAVLDYGIINLMAMLAVVINTVSFS
ncbi:MAG: hypothetical protein M1822_007325 [Bathelium mastoideum]|nr:MAG: hypothetical protein M1822_007325 [Bathelium mastoideum]